MEATWCNHLGLVTNATSPPYIVRVEVAQAAMQKHRAGMPRCGVYGVEGFESSHFTEVVASCFSSEEMILQHGCQQSVVARTHIEAG
jgi:hypothetical protein